VVSARALLESLGPKPSATARFISCAGPHASAWLLALPTSKATHMKDTHFAAAYRARIGLPCLSGPTRFICARQCHVQPADDPTHPFDCKHARNREVTYARHDPIKQLLANELRQAGAVVRVEGTYTNGKRPDIRAEFCDETVHIDISVTNPSARSYCRQYGQVSLGTAERRETDKTTRYTPIVEQEDPHGRFSPFVLEAFGAFGKCAEAHVDDIVKRAKEIFAPSADPADLRKRIIEAVSVKLQTGNAICLLANTRSLCALTASSARAAAASALVDEVSARLSAPASAAPIVAEAPAAPASGSGGSAGDA
jgi:hypothetical protein